MTTSVLCLRPEADFLRVGVTPPTSVPITYAAPDHPEIAGLVAASAALVIPAVGPKLATDLFKGSGVQFVQVTGAGVDRLDIAALRTAGIAVSNIPGGSNAALAEYVVSCAGVLMRRIAWSSSEIRSGRYVAARAAMLADNTAGLEGLTAGIVGLGVIGAAVAERLAQAGCKIVYFDPSPKAADTARPGWSSASLDDLLATSDLVTLHVPLMPSTQGLIGAVQLTRMKAGAILINAARGGIVDEAALVAALASGHLGGAAVDVYTTEPPPADNPLVAMTGVGSDRLILTPHIAGITRQAWTTLFAESWANVERVLLRGEAPLYQVN